MSHIVKVKLDIKNLNALKKAAKKLGLNWNEGVTSFNYYGSSTSTCDHTISHSGDSKSIGVVKKADGNYELQWDPGYLGRAEALVGKNADNLKKEYSAAVATLELESQGMFVTRYEVNGGIKLEASYA